MRHWCVAALALALLTAAQAAPRAELWPRWQAQVPGSATIVDHAAWDGWLQRYVRLAADGSRRVAYGAVSVADRALLLRYLDALQATPVSRLDRAEQRPFWINLYNAATVKVVLDHYPVDSILRIAISPGLWTRGPWGARRLQIEGAALSLDDVEHRILRPIWRDPRIHYAVNCAALGCPDLQPRAFRRTALEAQLDAAARAYVNHPRGARVDGDRLVVSSLYVWYQADFGGSEAGVIAHLRQYAQPPLAAALARVRTIDDDVYDWRLNDVR